MKTLFVLNDPPYGTERCYNALRLAGSLQVVAQQGGEIGVCATCMDARGLGERDLVESVRRSSLKELTDWTEWADRVLVF